VLSSRVIQCGVEERVVRRQEVAGVECFKCGEKGHKCRECPIWRKRGVKKVTYVAKPQKVQQKKLRRIKEGEAVHVTKPQEAQQ